MVKHIMIWTLQDKCFGPNLDSIKAGMKSGLESLNGRIPGLDHIEVHVDCLSSSRGDVICETTLDDEDALKNLKESEEYKQVTKEVVLPFIDKNIHVEYEC